MGDDKKNDDNGDTDDDNEYAGDDLSIDGIYTFTIMHSHQVSKKSIIITHHHHHHYHQMHRLLPLVHILSTP